MLLLVVGSGPGSGFGTAPEAGPSTTMNSTLSLVKTKTHESEALQKGILAWGVSSMHGLYNSEAHGLPGGLLNGHGGGGGGGFGFGTGAPEHVNEKTPIASLPPHISFLSEPHGMVQPVEGLAVLLSVEPHMH